jgi:pyruvate,water dikinase
MEHSQSGEQIPLLLSLDEVDGTHMPLVGGKAFRLAKLKQEGLNVPQGLVLTTAYFQAQLAHTRLTPLWAGSPDVAVSVDALNWLADTLKTKPLAPHLNQAILKEMERVFGPEEPTFAVRSSVVDEDQRDHSFAGIHLTELAVPRSAIPIAITRCWASALSGAAIQYRQQHGMSIQGIKIAILIQPMLTPEFSGIGFTLNPITGARNELVLEMAPGQGITLASGHIQPHMFRMQKTPPDYPLLEQTEPSPSQPVYRVVPFSAEERKDLARQLQLIEALFGEPQDIEWATAHHKTYILQTRPVTISTLPTQLTDQIWVQFDYPPPLPSPFFSSLLERSQADVLSYFLELGVDTGRAGEFGKLILGRPYLNLTLLNRMAAQLGYSLEGLLFGGGYEKLALERSPFKMDWRTAWRARRIQTKIFRQVQRAERAINSTEEQVDKLTTALKKSAATTAEWLAQARQMEELYGQLLRMWVQLETSTVLVAAVAGWLIDLPAAQLLALATQNAHTPDDEFRETLAGLAHRFKDDLPTRGYLQAGNFAAFADDPAVSPKFREEFEKLVDRFGQLAVHPADPASPRYREAPALLLALVQQRLQQTAPVGDKILQEAGWSAKLLVNRLERLYTLRHRLTNTSADTGSMCRRWGLQLGQQWVEAGWLAQPHDIFWLTIGEIERVLMAGESVGVTLSAAVQTRLASYRAYQTSQAPSQIRDGQLAAMPADGQLSGPVAEVAFGQPISPGQARGKVMVIRKPEEFTGGDGDIILVLPATGPEFLELLHRAAGLIVETGGLLSHGSVIAREYGIPGVANIPQATQRYRPGDTVLVDGSTGVVQVLESAA